MCDDKMLTFVACANKGIRMPDTFAGPLVYQDVKNPDLTCLPPIMDKLGFPMIVKKVYGSLGEGVFLVKNEDELTNLYKQICNSPVIFQKYVPSKNGRSIRVLIIDGKVFGCFARVNAEDFRSNFGKTASSKKIENNEKNLTFALKIAQKLNIFYAGIDLLFDENGDPILCEINSNAFFEEFEKTTGVNAAKLHAEAILRKIN